MRNNNRDSRLKPKRERSKGKVHRRGKEVEINVNEDTINRADLPHVITSGKSDNDPQWYMNLNNLGKDMASLPFNLPTGVLNVPFRDTSQVNLTNPNATYYSSPGIMVIELMPTIGKSNMPTSAINLAAQQLYTLTRKANSGAVNYDKTDLMLTIMAMDSAYMLYEYILRAYRTIGTYNYMNRYMPDQLLNSQGFDVSLTYNLAELRGILDMFAYKLASVNVPDQLDIIKRHSWLFSNVYTDASDIKAQLYLYRPTGLYVWKEGTGNAPTSLAYKPLYALGGNGRWTITHIKKAIDTVMNPILGSQDVGIISGDFAKAFGENGMIKIRPVSDYEAISPVYSKEVLLQMSNTYTIPNELDVPTPNALDITVKLDNLQSGPYLVQNVGVNNPSWMAKSIKPILNFIDIEPTPEMVMVATRLITLTDVNDGKKLLTYGTEIATNFLVYYTARDGSTLVLTIDSFMGESQVQMGNAVSLVTSFDWSPGLYFGGEATGTPDRQYLGNTIDLCNYTYVDDITLSNIHDVAVMSEFAVKDFNINT